MKRSNILYTCAAGITMLACSSCGAWMLSGGDLFYDDPMAPPPPQLYNPPLPGWSFGFGPDYYPGWNSPGYNPPPPAPPQNNNRPPQQGGNPPAQNKPQWTPSQPSQPSQPSNNGQRPGANINFGSGSSNSGSQPNRPSGGANGRH